MQWTREALALLLASIPFFISFFLLFREYRRYKDRSLFFLMFAWLMYACYCQMEAWSYILLSPTLFKLRGFFLVLCAIFISIGSDYMKQDVIDPLKIGLISLIGGLMGFSIIFPNSYEQYTYLDGEISYSTTGYYFLTLLFTTTIMMVIFLYYMGLIYLKSPDSLKKTALLNLIGSFLIGPVSFLIYASRLTLIFPGIIAIFSGIGALMSAIAFSRHPQLAYVLPSKPIKLAILQKDTSFLLFMHSWVKHPQSIYDLEDQIFTGMMQVIIKLIRNVVQQGEVREVKTDSNVFLIYNNPEKPYVIVLVATELTHYLRNSFSHFTFQLNKFENINNLKNKTSVFEGLVNKSFPYVPVFDDKDIPSKINSKPNSVLNNLPENQDLPTINSLCISCHNIKDPAGKWQDLVSFYQQKMGTNLAWNMCPDCVQGKRMISLSYFDAFEGPRLLVTIPEQKLPSELSNITNVLDSEHKDYYVSFIGDYAIAQYLFKLEVHGVRGRFVPLVLSYIVSDRVFDQKFARFFTKSIVDEILAIENIVSIFSKEKTAGIINLTSITSDKVFQHLMLILKKNFNLIPDKKIQFYLESQIKY